jgi:hypothetical protein
MMGRDDARNIQSFITKLIWIISASGLLFKKKSVTTQQHGNINVKFGFYQFFFNREIYCTRAKSQIVWAFHSVPKLCSY